MFPGFKDVVKKDSLEVRKRKLILNWEIGEYLAVGIVFFPSHGSIKKEQQEHH